MFQALYQEQSSILLALFHDLSTRNSWEVRDKKDGKVQYHEDLRVPHPPNATHPQEIDGLLKAWKNLDCPLRILYFRWAPDPVISGVMGPL